MSNTLIELLRQFLGQSVDRAHSRFGIRTVSRHPLAEEIHRNILIIVAVSGIQKWVYLRCPCGCNEVIRLSMMRERSPRWTVSRSFFGRVTIFPSVRRNDGCFSHFWIRKGVVKWCFDTGHPLKPNANQNVDRSRIDISV